MGLGIAALVLGFLALLLTWHWSKETSKLVKSEDERAKNLIAEGKKETQQMIEEGNKRAEEGKKTTQEMIDEGRKETQQMIEEGRKETKELIRYIASLISAEASKTRDLIKMP